MSTRADTWMKMYWGDYARDTGHLNALCHGAYLMLIKHYWCSGTPLRNDDSELWRVACCDSISEWRKIKAKILRLFILDGEVLRHKRVDAEILIATTTSEAKSSAGKKGAEARWAEPSVSAKKAPENDGSRIVLPLPPHSFANAASESEPEKELESISTPSLEAVEVKIAREEGDGWGADPFPRYQGPAIVRTPPPPPAPGLEYLLAEAGRAELFDPVTKTAREVPFPLEQSCLELVEERRAAGAPVTLKPVVGGAYLEPIVDAVCEAAKTTIAPRRGNYAALIGWLRDGIDFKATILPAIQRVAASPKYPLSVSSMNFFDRAVREAHARRRAA